MESKPSNIKEIRKKVYDKNNYRNRLEGLKELSEYDCDDTRRIVIKLLKDRVFSVKHQAFLIGQKYKYKINGKDIYLPKKDIGYKNKDFTKTFQRVKTHLQMDELDIAIFKSKFKELNPEMYDVMSYEKKNKFDNWIENIYKCLPVKKNSK